MAGSLIPSSNVGITVTVNNAQAQQAFAAMAPAIQQLEQRINSLSSGFLSLENVLKAFAIGTLFEMGKQFIEMAASMERLQTSLGILDGSTQQAASTITQLVSVAGKAPFSLNAITDAFMKMKSAGIDPITGADGSGPLQDLIDAVAAFGGSEQKFHNAAFAIQEIGGKGVVQMKELRRQLGDAIPSAIQLMAEGMGISISELTARVTKGSVSAEEGLTALFEQFHAKYAGAADLLSLTFTGSIGRIKTEINNLALSFNSAGGLDIFTAALQFIIDKLKELNTYLSSSDGQAMLHSFINAIASGLDVVVPIIGNVITVIENIGKVILGVLGALPPAMVAGGVVGYMMFGSAGLVIGALVAQFSGGIAELSGQIQGFITSTLSFLHSFGGDYILEAGLIGYMLFGTTGLVVFAAAELLDQLAGSLVAVVGYAAASAAAVVIMAVDAAHFKMTSFADAQKDAFNKIGGKNSFDQMGDKGLIRGLSAGNTPLDTSPAAAEGDAAATATPKLNSAGDAFKAMIDKIVSARKQYDDQFGKKPDAFGGPTDAQAKQIEKFTELSMAASDKLDSMQTNNNPLAKMEDKAGRGFDQMQAILDDMTAKLEKFAAAGDANKVAGYTKEIASLTVQMQALRETLGQLEQTSNDKITTDVQAKVAQMRSMLDASSAKTDQGTVDFAGAEASKKFQSSYTELGKLRQEIDGYIGDLGKLHITEDDLNKLEKDLNTTRDRAIVVARDLAQIKLQERDLAMQSHLADTASKGNDLEFANKYDKAGEAVAKVNDQYRHMFEQINKEILDAQAAMEQNPAQADMYQGIIDSLKASRDQIAATQADTVNRTLYETSLVGQAWKSVGATIDSSLSTVLQGLANNTLNLKDVMTKMYADITKAAADYIVKAAEAAMFGNMGGSGFNLFGATGGASGANSDSALMSMGSTLMSFFAANGGAFNGSVKMFANGGLIGGPTMFGIAGEAGKEAILPLETVGGKLGVRSVGGQSGDTHFHINALDAPSVRELLLREAPTIVAAHQSRQRLNSGVGRV
jgi:tape measure domain-containing protein